MPVVEKRTIKPTNLSSTGFHRFHNQNSDRDVLDEYKHLGASTIRDITAPLPEDGSRIGVRRDIDVSAEPFAEP